MLAKKLLFWLSEGVDRLVCEPRLDLSGCYRNRAKAASIIVSSMPPFKIATNRRVARWIN